MKEIMYRNYPSSLPLYVMFKIVMSKQYFYACMQWRTTMAASGSLWYTLIPINVVISISLCLFVCFLTGLQCVLHQALLFALCAGSPWSVSRTGSEWGAEEKECPEDVLFVMLEWFSQDTSEPSGQTHNVNSFILFFYYICIYVLGNWRRQSMFWLK